MTALAINQALSVTPQPDGELMKELASFGRTLVRQAILREEYFDAEYFADPAWFILMDLFIAGASNEQVSVTSLCHASRTPPTTALRWIRKLEDDGLLIRLPASEDGRRVQISLSASAAIRMTEYLNALRQIKRF